MFNLITKKVQHDVLLIHVFMTFLHVCLSFPAIFVSCLPYEKNKIVLIIDICGVNY